MKALLSMLVVMIGLAARVGAAETSVVPEPKRPATSSCDSVCQLQHQDMAFALLVETFRQFRSCQVETDFQTRLRGIEAMDAANASSKGTPWFIDSQTPAMLKLREFAGLLAREEKELRLAEIQTQVVNFENAYRCLRKSDEQKIGAKVPSAVDTHKAAEQLKDFVIVTAGSVANGNLASAQPVSAQSVLYDVEPATAFPSQMTEPCE